MRRWCEGLNVGGREGGQAIQNVHSVLPVHSECDVGDELPIKGVRETERGRDPIWVWQQKEKEREEGPSSFLDRPHSLPLSILLLFLAAVRGGIDLGRGIPLKLRKLAFRSIHPPPGGVVFLLLTLPAY